MPLVSSVGRIFHDTASDKDWPKATVNLISIAFDVKIAPLNLSTAPKGLQ